MKTQQIFLCFLLLLLPLSIAHEEDTFALGEQLIKDKIPCNNLSDAQLEMIGEYYMEQMHPGELHELMDARMGGEGSEQLRQVHITMAKNFYCGEHQALMPIMMNGIMGRTGGIIWGARYGMMSGWSSPQGMMAGSTSWLLLLLGIGLIILITLLIIKFLKEMKP